MSRIVAPTLVAIAWLLTIPAVALAGAHSWVEEPGTQVVFVCEHGNVKSLIAAFHFNRLVEERGLPFVAVSRGMNPDSTTVPGSILSGLQADGFDASSFVPIKLGSEELQRAPRVIAIGVVLPQEPGSVSERVSVWNDVPPASVDFNAATQVLKKHVEALIEDLGSRGKREYQP